MKAKLMKRIVVGPSHVVRWKTNIERSAAPSIGEDVVFLGFGGAPIWSAELADQVEREYVSGNTEIILLVGDARFGNRICNHDDNDGDGYPFADGFSAIDRELLTIENDIKLLGRLEAAIDFYLEKYEDSVRVIYWDAIGRRAVDSIVGRHIVDGEYNHPSWGQAVPGKHRSVGLIPLHEVFSLPLGEVCRLYLDDSIHPTTIGYYFLRNLVATNATVLDSFTQARSEVTHLLADTITKYSGGDRVLIAGDSIWIDVLRRNLGGSGMTVMGKSGIEIKSTGVSSKDDHISTANLSSFGRFIFVSHEASSFQFLSNNPALKAALANFSVTQKQNYLSWEGALSLLFSNGQLVSNRLKASSFSPADFEFQWGQKFAPERIRDIIEIGLRGEPTIIGLTEVIRRSFSGSKLNA